MPTNKPKELPLFKDIFPNNNLNNNYEQENSWLIEIITVAAESFGCCREIEYQEKICLLKNSPISGLSKKSLFWFADKFAWVFARVKFKYDYLYYHRWFFEIFFGKKPQKAPSTAFWTHLSYVRLEQKALARPNPSEPTFFHSGLSSYNDLLGYSLLAGKNLPVGVQILHCSKPVLELLLEYNRKSGRIFADTSAFSAFRKGTSVDFDEVFRKYFSLVEKADKPELLTLVAPDRVGQQRESLKLLTKYKEQIYKLICLGVDVIIPIQLGEVSLIEAYKQAVSILGTRAFRVGLPSNEKAVSEDLALNFIASIKPKSVHFLGLRSTKFKALVDKVKAISATHLSADATTLRSKLKKGTTLVRLIESKTNQAVKESLSEGASFLSYEALVDKIFNKPAFLSEAQAKHLARLLTSQQMEQERIVFAALSGIYGFDNGSRLGDLLDNHYEKEVVNKALKRFAHTLTKRAVSGNIRAKAIAEMHYSTNFANL